MFYNWRFWSILCFVCTINLSFIYAFPTTVINKKDTIKQPLHVKVVLSSPKKILNPIKKSIVKPIIKTKAPKKAHKHKISKPIVKQKTTTPLPKIESKKDTYIPIKKQKITSQKTTKQKEKILIDKEAIKNKWLTKLRQKIKANLNYPYKAQKRRQEGSVEVKLIVKSNGHLVSSKISKLSTYKSLNNASLELIQNIFPFLPFESSIFGQTIEVVIPINYKLKEKK